MRRENQKKFGYGRNVKFIKIKMRHPGIEPGPPRWQRGIIATRLMALPCNKINIFQMSQTCASQFAFFETI